MAEYIYDLYDIARQVPLLLLASFVFLTVFVIALLVCLQKIYFDRESFHTWQF